MNKIFDDLIPLLSVQTEPNVFPTYGLPDVILKYAKNISDVYGVPIEMTAMPLLVACGSAVQKKIWLFSGKYKNYAQFYLLINTPSGIGKSQPVTRAFAPLFKIDADNNAIYQNQLQAWLKQSKLNKRQKPPVDDPPKPFWRQLLTSDTTPEALKKLLYNNGSVTVCAQELSGWFKNFGRYNKGSEAQMYLELFDNANQVVNRVDDSMLIVEPFTTVIGTIQPKVASDTINSDEMQSNGLSSRFLYVTCADLIRPYKNDLVPDPVLVDNYESIIYHLVNLTDHFGVGLTPEAKQLYKDFGDYLTDIINDVPKGNDFLRSSLSKMEIHCLRLALAVHIVKMAEPNRVVTDIDAYTLQYAVDLCHYFIGNIPTPNSTGQAKINEMHKKAIEMLKKGVPQVQIGKALDITQQAVSTIKRKYNVTA